MDFIKANLSDLILFAHPTFGVIATMSAVWVLVEALNLRGASLLRLRLAAWVTAICLVFAWVLGGFWYVSYYAADKAVILKGPWPWAHDLFMETKEHLFFIPAFLGFYLVIVAARRLDIDTAARRMAIALAALIIVNGLAIEGAGAIVNHGAKIAVLRANTKAAE